MKPETLNICGIPYKIRYCQHQSDVDPDKRISILGCHDPLTRTISIYDKDLPIEAVWQEIFHEVLHGISFSVSLDILNTEKTSTITDEQKHAQLDSLASALTDFLFRNNLIRA